MEHEESALNAAGTVEIDSRSGAIFVACEGTFMFSRVYSNGEEVGEHEEASIQFNASVLLQPGEKKVLVSQVSHTLTIKVTLDPPVPPPGKALPFRQR